MNNTVFGFKLTNTEEIEEINSTARIFKHTKSGANLIYLSNDDDNKFFSISFKTPPANNTGLPHIMEHAVLAGSLKFPTKEPFVDMMKSSLNTFINAMTYPDRTLYPVGSQNPQDLKNLMDVYLDAVFFPTLLINDNQLLQEGWHYDWDDKKGEFNYNGIVYNEMKGNYSSPKQVLSRKIQNNLYQGSCYACDAGGNPDEIPNLTQAMFVAFHEKYYHPSNSLIYLYGNGNIEEHLKFIDQEYLSKFNSRDIKIEIQPIQSFKESREVTDYYSIDVEDNEEDKTFLTLNYIVDTVTNPETLIAMKILDKILLDSEASPLKRALINNQIGKEVVGCYNYDFLWPHYSIQLHGSNLKEKYKFNQIIDETLTNLIRVGIDQNLIESSIHKIEFQLKECNYFDDPKGLIYYLEMLTSWSYDADPFMHLKYNKILRKIKDEAKHGYFEKFIEKYFLINSQRLLLALAPKKGLDQSKKQELQHKLDKIKNSLTPQKFEQIKETVIKLKNIQEAPDTIENLAKIPTLKLEDLIAKAKRLPLIEQDIDGITLLHHPAATNDIAYLDLYFDTQYISKEELPSLALLTKILIKLGTKKYNFQDLSKEINLHIGGISLEITAFSNQEDFYPKVIVKSKTFLSKLPKLLTIVSDILNNYQLENSKHLLELIKEITSQLENSIKTWGDDFSSKRLSSYFSIIGNFEEATKGISYYYFLKDIEKNFEAKKDTLIITLKNLGQKIFNKNNLLIGLTSPQDNFKKTEENLREFISQLSSSRFKTHEYIYTFTSANDGLIIPSKIQSVCQGINLNTIDFKNHGVVNVISNILENDYLWNKIRVLGGAYGAFAKINRSGIMILGSVSDPHLLQSKKNYETCFYYLRDLRIDQKELAKFIIGTIGKMDYPLSAVTSGRIAMKDYIEKFSFENKQKERDQVLQTSCKEINELAYIFNELNKQNHFCVIGNEEKIKQHSNLFKNISRVFE